ncbi:MAG: HlyD family efflux transporter periplasmic adaptor subunit [Bacteroidales bacterium]|jgi:multidrug resistance efflux pump|nr:HlyD family efflux transporter periplasmic adaptor subunit [Bacteroidales bacterium]
MMEEYENIELRSESVQEILSRPPKWIVRWGITIVFFVVITLLVGSWFFQYPDIVSAKIDLTTENPPAPVLAKTTGKIQNLFVSDNDLVIKDQVVGVIENPGNYKSVESLINKLDEFNETFIHGEFCRFSKNNYLLGEIQTNYSNFYKNIDEYNKTIKLNYHNRKIELSNAELKKYDLYLLSLKSQAQIVEEEYQIIKNQYNRDSILYNQELLSQSDFEKSKSVLLSKMYNFEQSKLSITNTEIQIENLKQGVLELKLQHEKLTSDQIIYIQESYDNLITAIDTWKHHYVLIAPTSGIVTFNQFWNENQTVKAGETVLTIIPEDEGELIGKMQLSFQGAGKVKVGQLANIQFVNYPYMEFGMVKGIIKSISLAPNNNYYTTIIELPEGLHTFYGVDLEFKQEMNGIAEIITEDIRLLERMVRPLKYILKKNTEIGNINKR